uniref:Uncharacterized protein n=1 Tax=Candidatus Kentrum sp. UNK TaxID=2126344 RepID=A0A451AZ66_9GAMM|nr:MAG: hypothetical protein BECKUNK1418H_GA0071006_106013 [Candidatus Kentron sp. UNK]
MLAMAGDLMEDDLTEVFSEASALTFDAVSSAGVLACIVSRDTGSVMGRG